MKTVTITIRVPDEAVLEIDGEAPVVDDSPLGMRGAAVDALIRDGRIQEAREELELLKKDGYLIDPTGGEDDVLSGMYLNEDEVRVLAALIASPTNSLTLAQLKQLFSEHAHPGRKVGNVMSSLRRRFTSLGYQPVTYRDRSGVWHITASAAGNIDASGLLEELLEEEDEGDEA